MNTVFLTPEQAAEMLNLSTYTIRAYARHGIIPANKVGRAWRFSRDDLVEWVQAKRQSPSPPASSFVARDCATGVAITSPDSPSQMNERQEAIETLRSIRARAHKGNVSALLRESRRELLARGDADSDRE